jgi:formyl-CoA transferase
MYAFTAILTALYERSVSGVARSVEVSLFEALAEWMGAPAYYTQYGGHPPMRAGARHATIAPYGPFVVRGGATVLVAIQNEPEWASFCDIFLGNPDLAVDERFARNSSRVEHREALEAIITERFDALELTEAVSLLDRANVANSQLRTVAEFLDHPVLVGRDRWRSVDSPGGPVQALLPPATFDGFEARMDPIPAVGEHTAAILRSLGYDDAAIAALHEEGAV